MAACIRIPDFPVRRSVPAGAVGFTRRREIERQGRAPYNVPAHAAGIVMIKDPELRPHGATHFHGSVYLRPTAPGYKFCSSATVGFIPSCANFATNCSTPASERPCCAFRAAR